MNVIDRYKKKVSRLRVVQAGKIIEDNFDAIDCPNWWNTAYKYNGKKYRLHDSFSHSKEEIYSDFWAFDGSYADQRVYKFKDVIKPDNSKVPHPIWNISSATDCEALKCGDCLVSGDCYALRDENLYKSPLPYRRRQEMFWRNLTAERLAELFLENISDAKVIRFNEAGDFRSIEDAWKMDRIAMYLSYYNVKCYTYTARRSLKMEKFRHITIIGSSLHGLDGQFIMSKDAKVDAKKARLAGFRSMVCPADCYKCDACVHMKETQQIIYCQKH